MLKLGIFVLALHSGNSGPPEQMQSLVQQAVTSGRATSVGETAAERVEVRRQIAPGPPPALSFRLYEGKSRHRYENSGLMLDDAGH